MITKLPEYRGVTTFDMVLALALQAMKANNLSPDQTMKALVATQIVDRDTANAVYHELVDAWV